MQRLGSPSSTANMFFASLLCALFALPGLGNILLFRFPMRSCGPAGTSHA